MTAQPKSVGKTGNSNKTSDYGPAERLTHGEYRLEQISPRSFQTRLRRVDGTPFDVLLLDGSISDVQHSAAESFCAMVWRARMIGPRGSNYERSGSGGVRGGSSRQLDQFNKVIDALRVVRRQAGRNSERLLMSAALDDVLPEKHRGLLIRALDALVNFYTQKFARSPLPASLRLAV
jgi:hypothetical protein